MKRILLFFMVLTSAFTSTWADKVITDLSQISDSKVYTLESSRCFLYYSASSDYLLTSTAKNFTAPAKNSLDENQQFKFVPTTGGYYLYSVGAGEYIKASGSNGVYGTSGSSVLTISESSVATGNYKWYMELGGNGMNSQNAYQTATGILINSWTTQDAGNTYCITEVEEEVVTKTFAPDESKTYLIKSLSCNKYLDMANLKGQSDCGASNLIAVTFTDEGTPVKFTKSGDNWIISYNDDTYLEHYFDGIKGWTVVASNSEDTWIINGDVESFKMSSTSQPGKYCQVEYSSTYSAYQMFYDKPSGNSFCLVEVTTTPPTPTTSYTINYVNAADESVLYTTTKEFADGTEPTAAVMGWFGWTQGTQTVSDATKTITVPMTNLLGNRKWRVYTTDGVTKCYMKLASTNPENPTSGTPTPLSLTTQANASMFVFAPNVANEYGPEWSLQDIETEKYLGYDKWDSKAYDVAYNWTVILAEENSFYMYQPGTVDGNVSDKGRGYIGLEKNTDSPSTNYNAIYTNKTYDGANPVGSASDSTDPNTALKFYLQEVTSVDVTMHNVGSNYYATACYPFALKTDANTEAYYVTSRLSEDYLGVEKANVIPAGEAVLLVSTGGTAKLTLTDDAPDAVTNNIMAGTYFEKEITADDYVLGKYNDEVGFWHTSVLTLSAHKGYIPQANLPAASNGMAIRFGNLTAIENIQTGSNSVVYDLQGRRVATPVSGQLYIANGKKYIQK